MLSGIALLAFDDDADRKGIDLRSALRLDQHAIDRLRMHWPCLGKRIGGRSIQRTQSREIVVWRGKSQLW